jgi:hypothetical protein
MGVAYFIVPEREVEGLDTFVNGKFLAKCRHLDGLANEVGVRPLMDFFSMSPEDMNDLLGSEEEDRPTGEFEPEKWFEAEEGLVTVRGLIARLEAGPVDLPDDPLPVEVAEFRAEFPDLIPASPPPERASVVEDLREFEAVLARLASEGIRWHMAIDI